MKRQYFIFIFLFSFSTTTSSQNDIYNFNVEHYHRPFLYLKDGSLLLDGNFRKKKRVLGGYHFFDNYGKRIKLKDIKYLQVDNNLMAVIHDNYSYRYISGKYNVFVKDNPSSGSFDSSGNYRSGPKSKSFFYSTNLEDIKKLNYKNLKVDLANFQEDVNLEDQQRVVSYLTKGNKRNKTKKRLIWSGVGIVLAGMAVYQFGGGNEDIDPPPGTIVDPLVAQDYTKSEILGLAVTGVGIGFSVTGLLLKDESKFYLKAVEQYNINYSY